MLTFDFFLKKRGQNICVLLAKFFLPKTILLIN